MKNCGNCIYKDLLINEEPCLDCLYGLNWEPDEDPEIEKEDSDYGKV